MAMQTARKVLFLGPCPEDDGSVVVTVELTCGCRITRVLEDARIRTLAGGGQIVNGELPCPKDHEVPASIRKARGSSLVSRALGRR